MDRPLVALAVCMVYWLTDDNSFIQSVSQSVSQLLCCIVLYCIVLDWIGLNWMSVSRSISLDRQTDRRSTNITTKHLPTTTIL